MKRLVAVALLLAPAPAHAHGGQVHWQELADPWTFDPAITLPLLVAGALFAIGVARLWRRAGFGRGVRPWQAACFAGGWLTLLVALVSPLHWLGERLFVAHMTEHELLMAVAAPLLVLARPGHALLWALPPAWRSALGGAVRLAPLRRFWRTLTDPLVATLLHGAALWAWHAPALFDAALESAMLHWLQHLSFFVTALFFWWALLFGRARERGYGAAMFYLFATALHSGFLGILLTLAKTPLYSGQSEAAAWGLTRLEDQQLAGLLMWVPAGLVYAAAALVLAGLWISGSGLRAFAPQRRADLP